MRFQRKVPNSFRNLALEKCDADGEDGEDCRDGDDDPKCDSFPKIGAGHDSDLKQSNGNLAQSFSR